MEVFYTLNLTFHIWYLRHSQEGCVKSIPHVFTTRCQAPPLVQRIQVLSQFIYRKLKFMSIWLSDGKQLNVASLQFIP